MKYMLVLIGEEGRMDYASPEEAKAVMDRWSAFTKDLVDAGAFIAGEGLQESSTATTVRIADDGERLVTDGPYAETKEQLGGFYLIECDGLDEALDWAKKVPMQNDSTIEVRPVMDYTQYGYEEPGAVRETAS